LEKGRLKKQYGNKKFLNEKKIYNYTDPKKYLVYEEYDRI
jgi:hypothetical protein